MSVTLAKSSVGQRTQIGIQTSSGTGVPATRRMATMSIMPSPSTENNEYSAQGNKFPATVVPSKEWSTWKGDGVLSYGEAPLIFSSLLAVANPVTSGGISTWTMQPTDGAPDTPVLFTVEHGDPTDSVQTIDNVVTDLTIDWDRTAVKITPGGIGKAITTGFSLTSQAAIWTATVTGVPTGGTFPLTFNGQTTAGIAYNALASAVQSALVALSSIGAGNVSVSGSAGGPYTINLQGALNGSALAITASGASLTGGTSPGVTMLQTGTGVSFYEDKPVQPGSVSVYLDTTFGGLGGTLLTNVKSGSFSLTGRWGPDWIVDGAVSSYFQLVELKPKATLSLLLEATSNAYSMFAHYRAGDVLYLQLKCVGGIVASSTHYNFILNVPVQFSKLKEYSDSEGVYCIGFDLTPLSDPTAGYPVQIVAVNATAAL